MDSRSGVTLAYAPEDTLKSFVMEMYLKSFESDRETIIDESNSNVNFRADTFNRSEDKTRKSARIIASREMDQSKSAPSLVPPSHLPGTQLQKQQERPIKRPFLRKNQGFAAWCSRIRSSKAAIQRYSTAVRGEPSNEFSSREESGSKTCGDNFSHPPEGSDEASLPESKTLLARQYTYDSKWCPMPDQPMFPTSEPEQITSIRKSLLDPADKIPSTFNTKPPISQNYSPVSSVPTTSKKKVVKCAAVNDFSENGELEEFELLEKITEGSFCGENSSIVARMDKDSLRSKLSSRELANTNQKSTTPMEQTSNLQCQNRLKTVEILNEPLKEETLCCQTPPKQETVCGLPVPFAFLRSSLLQPNQIAISAKRNTSEYGPMEVLENLDEFGDDAPWKDDSDTTEVVSEGIEVVTDATKPSKVASETRTHHCVRFNIPEEEEEAAHIKQNPDPPDVEDVFQAEKMSLPPKYASSAVIRQWIARLEVEVKRFNAENAALTKLRKEREESCNALVKERQQFEEQKAKEMIDFEDHRREEIAKLKKEKRVLADYHRSLQSMPNKKDREEIERLKQQLAEQQTEAAQRETRLQNQLTRQRARLEELSNERAEMLERIKRLEQARLALQTSLSEERAMRAVSAGADSTDKPKHRTLDSVSQAVHFAPKPTDRCSAGGSTKPLPLSSRVVSPSNLPFVMPRQLAAPIPENNSFPCTGAGEVVDSSTLLGNIGAHFKQSIHQNGVSRDQPGLRDSMASDYYTGDDDCTSSNASSRYNRPEVLANDETSSPVSDEIKSSTRGPYEDPVIDDSPMNHFNRGPITREVRHPDGSVEKQFGNGGTIVHYANGSVKEIYPDGKTSLVSLFNGDTKRTLADGSVVYTYSSEGTVQTTFPDGTEQIIYKDGRKEITYPQKPSLTGTCMPSLTSQPASESSASTTLKADPNPVLVEESCVGNGITIRRFSNGDRIIDLANGQKEIHCSEFKRRVYPDGTAKTVYKDGRQETCYASGRVRVKDGLGNLLVDTRIAPLSASLSNVSTAVPPPPRLIH